MVAPGDLPLTLIRGIEFDEIIFQCKDENVSVTGTLNPNVVGTFVPCGFFATFQLYILAGAPSTFLYYNAAAASYVIARLLTTAALTDFWVPAVGITEPTGTYVAHGANTGTATVTDHPTDLTGYTAEATVRRTTQTEVLLDLQPSITDAVNGEITVPMISKTDTAAIDFVGTFHWDLVLNTVGDGRVGPFVQGKFIIYDNITQLP